MTQPFLKPNHLLKCVRCGHESLDDLACPSCGTATVVVYKPQPGAPCRECWLRSRDQGWLYSVQDDSLGGFTWNVRKAIALVNSRRAEAADVPEVPVETLARFLAVTVTEEQHYDHVDPAIPGIIAVVPLHQRGTPEPLLCMIDGNHRAARCLRDGMIFRAHQLDWRESSNCLIVAKRYC